MEGTSQHILSATGNGASSKIISSFSNAPPVAVMLCGEAAAVADPRSVFTHHVVFPRLCPLACKGIIVILWCFCLLLLGTTKKPLRFSSCSIPARKMHSYVGALLFFYAFFLFSEHCFMQCKVASTAGEFSCIRLFVSHAPRLIPLPCFYVCGWSLNELCDQNVSIFWT